MLRLSILLLTLILFPNISSGEAPRVDLRITPGDWGQAPVADIEAVCRSVAKEFFGAFDRREWDPISVTQDKRGPMVIYGLGERGERRVLLNTRDTYWSQYAYQFSHECCHIACNYRDGNKANHWFEESLCEAASLFTLRRMATTWQTDPPYSNWKDYSRALADYVDDRIAATEKLRDKSLAAWYRENEAALRKNSTDRAKNQIVALALLPLLEKDPQHWNAVAYLNQGDAERELTFAEFLQDWHDRVPKQHQPFVVAVSDLFETKIGN